MYLIDGLVSFFALRYRFKRELPVASQERLERNAVYIVVLWPWIVVQCMYLAWQEAKEKNDNAS
jgi:hypothetical protein